MQDTIVEVIDAHLALVHRLREEAVGVIERIARAVSDTIRRGGRVYVCGNGGSAADAQHIAGELVGRFERDRRALPALALTTDTSILTSIGNDISFDDVFVRQVEAFVRRGDLLWAISTSGKSPNVLKAARLAKELGATVVAFTGRAASALEQLSDLCLCADHPSTARSQEVHQLAYHVICALVERTCDQEPETRTTTKEVKGKKQETAWHTRLSS